MFESIEYHPVYEMSRYHPFDDSEMYLYVEYNAFDLDWSYCVTTYNNDKIV